MKSEPDTPGGGGRYRGQRQRWGGRKKGEREGEMGGWERVTRDGQAGAVSLKAELQMAREMGQGGRKAGTWTPGRLRPTGGPLGPTL